MPRARNIKPGFFKRAALADAGPYAQLLFIGLWCLADKAGRLKDEPREIAAEIFPFYAVEVDAVLTSLERLGHIQRYAVEGIRIIQVVNFEKHQRPHHTEKPSELPPASDCFLKTPDNNGYLTVKTPLEHRQNPPDLLIPDLLIPDSRTSPSPVNNNPTDTGVHADGQLARVLETAPYPTARPLPKNYLPPAELFETLQIEHGIHRHFAYQQLAEFTIFWTSQNAVSTSWDARFYRRCVARWRARFPLYAVPIKDRNPDDEPDD